LTRIVLFINFKPAFSLGVVWGQQPQVVSKHLTVKLRIVLHASHRSEPKRDPRCNHATWSLAGLWVFSQW